VVFESAEPRHQTAPSGSTHPVSTSVPQFGQDAFSIAPTMNVKSHSGQEIFGEGGSGRGGGGG
jgi:hypothetical protein